MTQGYIWLLQAFSHHGFERDASENILCSLGCFLKSHSAFSVLWEALILSVLFCRTHSIFLLSIWKCGLISHIRIFLTIFSPSLLSPKFEIIFKVITALCSKSPRLYNSTPSGKSSKIYRKLLGHKYICILNGLLCQRREFLPLSLTVLKQICFKHCG